MPNKIFRPFEEGWRSEWGKRGATTKVLAADPGDPIKHDDNSSFVSANGSGDKIQAFTIDPTFPEAMATVNTLTVFARARDVKEDDVGIRVGVRLAGITDRSARLDIPLSDNKYKTVSQEFTRPGGGSWTDADLRGGFQFYIERGRKGNGKWVSCTSVWVEVDYIPGEVLPGTPLVTELSREVASRALRWSRLPFGEVEVVLPIEALDAELMTDFNLTHFAGPHDGGEGWKRKDWQRRTFRLIGTSLDPNNFTVTLRGRDLRRYATWHWDSSKAPSTVQSISNRPDGPARLNKGTSRTFIRATSAWIEDGGGVVRAIIPNVEKIGTLGTIIEGVKENNIKNSSFSLGLAGWSPFGGAALEIDETDRLFDEEIALGSMKMTGTGSGGDVGVQQPETFVLSAGRPTFWIEHKDDSETALTVSLRRNDSGDWLQENRFSWGATEFRFAMPIASTRQKDKIVFSGFSGDTLTPFIYTEATGSPVHHIYHVQIETDVSNNAVTTRIVTRDTGAVTRNADLLTITNNAQRRAFPNEAGTMYVKFEPFWTHDFETPQNFSDWPGGDLFIYLINIDQGGAGDSFLRYFINDEDIESHWQFGHLGGISSTDAATVVNANQVIEFACRWTSSRNELDLGINKVQILFRQLNGEWVKGSVGTHSGVVGPNISNLYQGRKGVNETSQDEFAWGAFKEVDIIPFVLTDEEIFGLP